MSFYKISIIYSRQTLEILQTNSAMHLQCVDQLLLVIFCVESVKAWQQGSQSIEEGSRRTSAQGHHPHCVLIGLQVQNKWCKICFGFMLASEHWISKTFVSTTHDWMALWVGGENNLKNKCWLKLKFTGYPFNKKIA